MKDSKSSIPALLALILLIVGTLIMIDAVSEPVKEVNINDEVFNRVGE